MIDRSVPYPPDIDWYREGWRFGRYGVRRRGWRYDIGVEDSDGMVRPTYTGKFWRWDSAARLAQALMLAHYAGLRGEGATISVAPDEAAGD